MALLRKWAKNVGVTPVALKNTDGTDWVCPAGGAVGLALQLTNLTLSPISVGAFVRLTGGTSGGEKDVNVYPPGATLVAGGGEQPIDTKLNIEQGDKVYVYSSTAASLDAYLSISAAS